MEALTIMTPDPFCLRKTDTIQYAAQEFRKRKIDGAPVVDEDGRLIGIFTKGHLMEAVADGLQGHVIVGQLMKTKVVQVYPDNSLEEIWNSKVGRLPVVDKNGKLLGIITRTDLVQAFFKKMEQVCEELKAVLQSIYNGVIVVNSEGIITLFNHAAERIIGVEAKDAVGKPIKKIIPQTGLMETLRTGKYEYSRKVKLNDVVVVTNRMPIIKNGQTLGAVAVFQDISDLEAVFTELEASQRLNKELQDIIDAVHDGIYVTDGQGITTRINKSFTRMTGIKEEEVIGRHMQELKDEGYCSESVTLLVLKRKQPVSIMQTIKGGKRLLITGTPIFDDEGKISRVVTNSRDITELINLKAKLEQSEQLTEQYKQELEHLRSQQRGRCGIIAQSKEMKQLVEIVHRASEVDATVLILGETGVGKEVVAREIHRNSTRKRGPFIKVNCAAIPESLLESELFGYEKGAFTGAQKQGKPGMFEIANSGTILLDEIGEMPIKLQAKLLRVVQEKEVTRIGGTHSRALDVRIIAATNQDLEELIKKGLFREDLYYRLNVLPIKIPPLRSRKTDIPLLVHHFLKVFNKKYSKNICLDPSALQILNDYHWPGNVRQLENLIERLVVISKDNVITHNHLYQLMEMESGEIPPHFSKIELSLNEAVSLVEKQLIAAALTTYGSTRKAARALRVSQPTLIRKAKKYGISGKVNNNKSPAATKMDQSI